jgi:hypothetical protein
MRGNTLVALGAIVMGGISLASAPLVDAHE